MAGIVRGSEGLMRILKRLEEDFPQLRYHRQAGLNVCVCVCVTRSLLQKLSILLFVFSHFSTCFFCVVSDVKRPTNSAGSCFHQA